jgi:hypothetical protein
LISGRGRNFSLLQTIQTSSGANPASYAMGTRGSFHTRRGVGGGRVAQAPPPSAEIKNGRAIHPLPPYVFMAWCLINKQGQLLPFYKHGSDVKDFEVISNKLLLVEIFFYGNHA